MDRDCDTSLSPGPHALFLLGAGWEPDRAKWGQAGSVPWSRGGGGL